MSRHSTQDYSDNSIEHHQSLKPAHRLRNLKSKMKVQILCFLDRNVKDVCFAWRRHTTTPATLRVLDARSDKNLPITCDIVLSFR